MRAIYAASSLEAYDLLELLDGRVFERSSRPQVVDDRNVGRVWSFRDITPQRRAEELLLAESERFRTTLASIGDAVVSTDAEGRITFLNRVAETLTGWRFDEARGRPLPGGLQHRQPRHPRGGREPGSSARCARGRSSDWRTTPC